ncbi:hypothetical protein Avbf_12343 [Armadillidium vulgare]|nr:hypothetical protein Avbf_12343 [Armadillidium vulgare]
MRLGVKGSKYEWELMEGKIKSWNCGVNKAWDRVRKEYDEGKQNAADNRGEGILFYERDTKHPDLENFKPFDLDLYWGKKMYKNSIQQR